ncbi:hypothetical protein [Winogradskyella bathintestinalis]|uniref:Uncharacterized protein n=1 Tax=Winogradskyella bathintestinalis TaxID=3035208 RepID=A0ABT7ZU55_9FLAO|nr:hypothetical protein [Winogradskyella bathintestinalis]MDN3492559.1 hypothetical protein [Winogradskyella bathintestinalis]
MNKLGKILVVAAATSGIAYITRKWWNIPSEKLKSSDHTSRIKTSKSNTQKPSNANRDLNDNSDSDERTQRMYNDLGMTEEQRKRYVADYRAVVDDWKNKNPNQDMDEQIMEEQHSATLNAVLNEAQYAMYRDWSKQNPN